MSMAEQAAGRVPVILAARANSTKREFTEAPGAAKGVGADSQLQVVPYYNKPTQEGQYRHFKAIAEATGDLPMVLYNVPGRTVADMAHDTVLRLARAGHRRQVKEATGNIERAQWLIKEAPTASPSIRATTRLPWRSCSRRPGQHQRHRARGAPDA